MDKVSKTTPSLSKLLLTSMSRNLARSNGNLTAFLISLPSCFRKYIVERNPWFRAPFRLGKVKGAKSGQNENKKEEETVPKLLEILAKSSMDLDVKSLILNQRMEFWVTI